MESKHKATSIVFVSSKIVKTSISYAVFTKNIFDLNIQIILLHLVMLTDTRIIIELKYNHILLSKLDRKFVHDLQFQFKFYSRNVLD